MTALRPLLGVATLFALGASAALCAEVPIPAAPTHWATDTAGFLSPQTVEQLDARLHAYETTTGHQVLVYVAPTTGQTPTEDWTVRAFQKWKVGRKGLDDGLILFVFSSDHKVRIEVGYGLEATVPDAIASRIIRETITPQLRAGHADQAVTAGVNSLLGVIGGETSGQTGAPEAGSPTESSTSQPLTGLEVFIIFILVIVALAVIVGMVGWAARHPGVFIAGTLAGSSRGVFGGGFGGGGFSGFGGGGFSGGGGMSGGGGATGSW